MTIGNLSIIQGYWGMSTIKFENPIPTPCGSRVTVVRVSVDIQYSIKQGRILILDVKHSQTGQNESNMISVKTGEAWHGYWQGSELALKQLAQQELSIVPSRLGRLMIVRWKEDWRNEKIPYMAEPFKFDILCDSVVQPNVNKNKLTSGICEGCGRTDELVIIGSGQMLCKKCFQEIDSSV